MVELDVTVLERALRRLLCPCLFVLAFFLAGVNSLWDAADNYQLLLPARPLMLCSTLMR